MKESENVLVKPTQRAMLSNWCLKSSRKTKAKAVGLKGSDALLKGPL